MVKVYPIECYVQRQQLKFIWKIWHLDDFALQRIVLHGKLDLQYSQGRGGRQRTYKQCIKDALENVKVTMEQCMAMEQHEWNMVIKGIGLETAVQQWEARTKASKSSDVKWRSKAARGPGQKALMPTDGKDAAATDSAEESENESDTENDPGDDFAQFPPSQQEENADIAEDAWGYRQQSAREEPTTPGTSTPQ